MTAGQPEGVGQQQGLADEHRANNVAAAYDASEGVYGSPTPPARDSGRDEAREAVARWLTSETLINDGATWSRRVAKDAAEELLALPELDKLLRRPA